MPSPRKPFILLVNPWIHDFAAYDFWMKPLGLLYIGAILRAAGCEIELLDCLDFHSLPQRLQNELKTPQRRSFGTGHFFREEVPKPNAFKNVRRRYRRYGVPPGVLERVISEHRPPDLILVTSSMTYWYTGVRETIRFLRKNFPGVPILLGGIYATLCRDHAIANSGADRVLAGPWDEEKMKTIAAYLGDSLQGVDCSFLSWPYPAFDLYSRIAYVCLLTRRGCPFSCPYCASSKLAGAMETRPASRVIEEVAFWEEKFRVRDFAIYDDALLIHPAEHILPLLSGLIQRNLPCNFHTPNALHARSIDEGVADLLFRGRVKTIRLGLETSEEKSQKEMGGKVSNEEFRRAVRNLKKAGYADEEIGTYLMVGLPGQRSKDAQESVAFVREAGAKPILVEYSPIPGTPLFEKAKRTSSFDIDGEPLFQNNSILPCQWEGFTWADYRRLKESVRN